MEMNDLGNLNDYMFEQVERLNELDLTDLDGTKAEIARSRALLEVGKVIIENAQTVLEATRFKSDFPGTQATPRMLDA